MRSASTSRVDASSRTNSACAPARRCEELEAAILRQDDSPLARSGGGRGRRESAQSAAHAGHSTRMAHRRGAPGAGNSWSGSPSSRGRLELDHGATGSVAAIDTRTNEVVADDSGERPTRGCRRSDQRRDLGRQPGGQDADAARPFEPQDRAHDRPLKPRRPASTSGWERCGWRTAAPGSCRVSTPAFDRVTKTVDLVGRAIYAPAGSVAVGGGSFWVVFGKSRLVRVDPADLNSVGICAHGRGGVRRRVRQRLGLGRGRGYSSAAAFRPRAFHPRLRSGRSAVGTTPARPRRDGGVLWATIAGDDVVARIDADSGAVRTIPVGAGLRRWPSPRMRSGSRTGSTARSRASIPETEKVSRRSHRQRSRGHRGRRAVSSG